MSSPIPHRRLLLALTGLVALSAIGGATPMLLHPEGSPGVPLWLLDNAPFNSFLLPGLLLGGVVGGINALCAVLLGRRSRWARDAAVVAGGAQTVWIAVELALLGQFSWLQAVYGLIGLGILVLALGPGWPPDARMRWVTRVTLSEALGFCVPVAVGLATTRLPEGAQGLLLVLAGAVEGLLLGAGQALGAPVPLQRARYAGFTALGAALAWGAAMGIRALAGLPAVPPAVVAIVGVVGAILALLAMGALQARELAPQGVRAGRWVAWTALAWILALPMSFLPAPLVDEATPAAVSAVLWVCAGLMMAYVMALVSWRGFGGSASTTGARQV